MRSTLTTVSMAAMAVALSAPASAQDASATTTASTPADEQVADVIVTATRRNESIQNVAVSVAKLDDAVIDAVNASGADVRGLSGRVPSLNIESSFGRTFPRFYIRGLGNTDFDLNASQPVSVVMDDVVLENPILKGFPVFDNAGVEVLRGPQGTLFGRNTPAGIVKFDIAKPGDNKGYIKIAGGSFGTASFESASDNKLGKVSMRSSVLISRRSDWVDNLDAYKSHNLEGFKDTITRSQFAYDPAENWSLRAMIQNRTYNGDARVFRANAFHKGDNKLYGVDGGKFRRDQVRHDGLNSQKLTALNMSLHSDVDLGKATLYYIGSYWKGTFDSRGDIDGGFGNQFAPTMAPGFIPFSAQSQDKVDHLGQSTHEVRFASNGSPRLGYQAGVFLFFEKLRISSFDFANPKDLTPAAIAKQNQRSQSFGVFGSLNYTLDSGTKLTAGARWNDDHRDMTASRPTDGRPGFLGFGGTVPTRETEVNAENLTWDVSAMHPLNDDVNLFARVAKGYRAPSIQGRLLYGRDLSVANSEKTMSYEAGVKSMLLDKTVRFNLTGYYFDTSDMQLTAVGGANNFTRLLNADHVRGHGLEAELQARPMRGLEVAAGLSYNHTRIDDPNAFVAGCAANCTVLDPVKAGSPGIYSINGNSLPQAPKLTLNGSIGYTKPLAKGGELFAFSDWYARSRVQFFLYNSAEFSDDRQIEGGLRLGWRNKMFNIAAFGRNILNDTSAVSGIDFNNLTAMVNEPRIFGLEAGMTF